MAASRNSAPPNVESCAALLEHGTRLRLRAPELTLAFAERAVVLAEAAGSDRLWAHAEGLAVFAQVRLGRRAEVVDRAVAVLRAAEDAGYAELAASMRTELALCARSVGSPLTGMAILRPVLADIDVDREVRVFALLQLVGCMASLGRPGVLDRALDEADQLACADSFDADTQVTLRAMVRICAAAHLRRHGDLEVAAETAQQGLDLVDELSDANADGCQVRARLTLELVSVLLERGAADEAAERAAPLLNGAPRAAAVAPLAWLRLAVATRIHLPAGQADAASSMVRDALYFAQRHGLGQVTARLWLELAHIEERFGRLAEAVRCLREARAAEFRCERVRRQALGLLTGEFGRGEQPAVDIHRMLGAARGSKEVPPPRAAVAAEGLPEPVVEHVPEPAVEHVPEPAVEHVPEPAVEPVAEPAVEPAAEPAVEPAAEPAVEPVAEPAVEPVAAETVVEPAAEAVTEPVVEPAAETVVEPVFEPATDDPAPAEVDVAEPAQPEWPDVQQDVAETVQETLTEAPDPVARHEATSASAADVLKRLGVRVGSGGRRRARDSGDQRAADESAAAATEAPSEPAAEPASVADARPEPASADPEPEPQELNTVLAVFSHWANEDSAAHAGAHVINGDTPAAGRHRSEA